MQIDLNFVRSQFPAFSDMRLRSWIFCENAGGSYPCQAVTDRLMGFYRQTKMQPYYPAAPSMEAGSAMDEARVRLAAWLGVTEDWVSFGPSTTQNTYILSKAFEDWLSSDDVVIVTNQDHESNTGPWRRLAAKGIEIREWSIDKETGRLDASGLESNLCDRVKLVAFPHCSNIIGEIHPVADWVEIIHNAGAYACVDGVSYAPHGLPNVPSLGADIYLFSTYKTFGPHQGVLVMSPELAFRLPNQGHEFNGGNPTKRFTPAGPDHAQVAAIAGIVDYFEQIDAHHYPESDPPFVQDRVNAILREQEVLLTTKLLDQVDRLSRARLLGPSDPSVKAPTISLCCNRPGIAVARDLADLGIIAGGGDFYGGRVLDAMGIERNHGVLRLSLVHYNSMDEVDRLSEALVSTLG